MKRKKITLGVVCNKCGKSAPVDEEKSNENWKAYKTSEPCECGGKFGLDFSKIPKNV